MKRSAAFALLLALLLVNFTPVTGAPAAPAGASNAGVAAASDDFNLIPNGDFETGVYLPWFGNYVSAGDAHSGSYGLGLGGNWFSWDYTYTGDTCKAGPQYQLKPNTWYEWSIWSKISPEIQRFGVKAETTTDCAPPVFFGNFTDTLRHTLDWEQFGGTFKTGNAVSYGRIVLGVYSDENPGFASVDDAVLREIAAPTNTPPVVQPGHAPPRGPARQPSPRPRPARPAPASRSPGLMIATSPSRAIRSRNSRIIRMRRPFRAWRLRLTRMERSRQP